MDFAFLLRCHWKNYDKKLLVKCNLFQFQKAFTQIHLQSFPTKNNKTRNKFKKLDFFFFFLLVLGNSGCLNKWDMKNVMHYVSSNSLRPHKKLWNQQKGHCLYWDVSFSQAEAIYSDYWIILVVLSFQCTDHDVHLEPTTQYRVHIIHRCTLASSIILSKCTHPPSIHCFLL